MSDKKVTLLKSLMKCFSASKSDICYVVKNGNKYCMPPENVVEWWKLLYCKNIVALSIAPQSHNQQLSQDALSAFVRKVVNDKNKNIVETNLNPRLMRSSKCTELIIEEIEHLGETIELGVRAKHSPCDKYTHEIRENELKSSTDVKIFMDEAIEFLEHLFFATPFGIIKQENSWFVNSIPKLEKEKGEHYTKEQVLMMLACALILGLNVNDLPQVNSNIKEFIVSAFSDEGKGTPDSQDAEDNNEAQNIKKIPIEQISSKKTPTSKTKNTATNSGEIDEDTLVRNAAFVWAKNNHTVVDTELREDMRNVLHDVIMQVTREVWQTFDLNKKFEKIFERYAEVLEFIEMLGISNSK